MSEDEIAIMDGGKCILQLRGVRPFFSEKFDITKHPHYKYLADAFCLHFLKIQCLPFQQRIRNDTRLLF